MSNTVVLNTIMNIIGIVSIVLIIMIVFNVQKDQDNRALVFGVVHRSYQYNCNINSKTAIQKTVKDMGLVQVDTNLYIGNINNMWVLFDTNRPQPDIVVCSVLFHQNRYSDVIQRFLTKPE